jgi:hypothetical protein
LLEPDIVDLDLLLAWLLRILLMLQRPVWLLIARMLALLERRDITPLVLLVLVGC